MPLRPIEVFRPICSFAKWPYTVMLSSFLASTFYMSSSSCFHAAVRMFFWQHFSLNSLPPCLLLIICTRPENKTAKIVDIACNIIKFWAYGCYSVGMIPPTFKRWKAFLGRVGVILPGFWLFVKDLWVSKMLL